MRRVPLYIGVDLGTSGVRSLAVTDRGDLLARSSQPLDKNWFQACDDRHEQDSESWWLATCACLKNLVSHLHNAGISTKSIRGLAVDGTSGTLVCVDSMGNPIAPAIMYNDSRAGAQAQALNDHAESIGSPTHFSASFALAKILWIREHKPEDFARTKWFAHQADLITGRLTGQWGVTDYSNALKMGFDLREDCWPGWIAYYSGLAERLPQVVPPASPIGTIRPRLSEEFGLPSGLPIISGATDGTSGFLASGARKLGDDNTTLGTTLVFKRLIDHWINDPSGRLYSHKLPGGLWLPGAASNTGGQWIEKEFPQANLRQLDEQALDHLPSQAICYPLSRIGERFPFQAPEARGFYDFFPQKKVATYAARLQGVAMLERLAYEVLDEVLARPGAEVYTTGGAGQSDIWTQLRANVIGRPIHRPACPESAFGSSVLAAAGTDLDGVWSAIGQMVRIEKTFEPDASSGGIYESLYQRFKEALKARGYLG